MNVDEEKQLKELVASISNSYGLEDDYYGLFVTDGKNTLPLNFIVVELYMKLRDNKGVIIDGSK